MPFEAAHSMRWPTLAKRQAAAALGRRRRAPCRAAHQRLVRSSASAWSPPPGPRHRARRTCRLLGAFNIQKPVEAIYQTLRRDAGGRLAPARQRNLKNKLKLPRPLLAHRRRRRRRRAQLSIELSSAAMRRWRSKACSTASKPPSTRPTRISWPTSAAAHERGSRLCATASALMPRSCDQIQRVAGRNFNVGARRHRFQQHLGQPLRALVRSRSPACMRWAAASARACRWRSARAARRDRPGQDHLPRWAMAASS